MQVENRVVGAPCGVMDQMASACGEANKLLAMVCQVSECLSVPATSRSNHSCICCLYIHLFKIFLQPAEVAELVNIPTNSYTF